MTARLPTLLTFVLFVFAAPIASADVIAPGREPAPCPPGTMGGRGHGSCVINPCDDSGACRTAGQTCQAVKYCTHDYEGQLYTRNACTQDSDCTVPGDACRESRACVGSGSGGAAASNDDDGLCTVSHPGARAAAGGLGLLLGLAALGLAVLRRSGPRPRGSRRAALRDQPRS